MLHGKWEILRGRLTKGMFERILKKEHEEKGVTGRQRE